MDMLFVRDFAKFTGGHLKFSDYMRHTSASGLAEPVLYQTPRSRGVPGNIFDDYGGRTLDVLRPFPAYFVAGEDWFILDEAGVHPNGAPVVNLIQGFRHVDRTHPLFECLARPALRICVSERLAKAVQMHANGEVCVIENGIEVIPSRDRRPLFWPARVLIAGLKHPEIARAVAARINSIVEIDLVTEMLPRPVFLSRMAKASICVLLPMEREGFFLPPLEAMALGRGVVTPWCDGNLAYCRSGENCLMPAYDAEALAAAVLSLAHDSTQLTRLATAGLASAAKHSIANERNAYHILLARYLRRSL